MTTRRNIDAVTFEVIRNKLDGVVEEMSLRLIRGSFSPLVKEGFDAAATLFTRNGELLVQSVSPPGLLSALVPCVKAVLARYPLESAKEGDIYLMNDPYHGASHLPDIAMVMPVFHRGDVIALSCTTAHHQDVGGMTPGSVPTDATEIFQEGLRIPPLKYRDGGIENEALVAIIKLNVRTPYVLMGDLKAQEAACLVGASRLRELAEQYGDAELLACCEELLDRSEQMTRDSLRRIPDGTYRYVDYIDNDGVDLDRRVAIKATVTVEQGSLSVDFTGSSAQVRGPINCALSAAQAAVYFAIRAVTDPQIPTNGGCFRVLKLVVPEGSIIGPVAPAPVSVRTVSAKRIASCVLGALREALPDQLPADAASAMFLLVFAGRRNGQAFISGEMLVGGAGGGPESDGVDSIDSDFTNTMNIPVEAFEMDTPVRVHRFELREGSGGAGRYRGGLGVVREFEVLEGDVTFTHRGERHFCAAQGFRGAGPGAVAESEIVYADGTRTIIPSKGRYELSAGDRVIVKTPGGGGYGRPSERDEALIRDDMLNGKA